MLMVETRNKIRKMNVRNGHLILKLHYRGNVFDSQVIFHRCLCGIMDGVKKAEMTKINGVVITESQLFDCGSDFSFPVAYEAKATAERGRNGIRSHKFGLLRL